MFAIGSLPKVVSAAEFMPLHPIRMHFDLDFGVGTIDPAQAHANYLATSGFAFGASLVADIFDLVSLSTFGGTVFVNERLRRRRS